MYDLKIIHIKYQTSRWSGWSRPQTPASHFPRPWSWPKHMQYIGEPCRIHRVPTTRKQLSWCHRKRSHNTSPNGNSAHGTVSRELATDQHPIQSSKFSVQAELCAIVQRRVLQTFHFDCLVLYYIVVLAYVICHYSIEQHHRARVRRRRKEMKKSEEINERSEWERSARIKTNTQRTETRRKDRSVSMWLLSSVRSVVFVVVFPYGKKKLLFRFVWVCRAIFFVYILAVCGCRVIIRPIVLFACVGIVLCIWFSLAFHGSGCRWCNLSKIVIVVSTEQDYKANYEIFSVM